MAAALPVRAQHPALTEVLDRVAEYLAQYGTRLSTIVAEEQYEQVDSDIDGG
jgi:hypothetical protein